MAEQPELFDEDVMDDTLPVTESSDI